MTEQNEYPTLAPRDGDLELVYQPTDPGHIREQAEYADQRGNPAAARLIRDLDRRNTALLHEVKRLGQLVSQNFEQAVTAETEVLRRQADQLRQALQEANRDRDAMRADSQDQLHEVLGRLAKAKDHANRFHNAWAASEARLVQELTRRGVAQREPGL